jgi:hypothetical protein
MLRIFYAEYRSTVSVRFQLRILPHVPRLCFSNLVQHIIRVTQQMLRLHLEKVHQVFAVFYASFLGFVMGHFIVKQVSWFKSSLLLSIKTVDITNINS